MNQYKITIDLDVSESDPLRAARLAQALITSGEIPIQLAQFRSRRVYSVDLMVGEVYLGPLAVNAKFIKENYESRV